MSQTSHFQVHKQPIITYQDVFYVLTLIAICLWFSLVPTHAFGQPTLGSSNFPAFDSDTSFASLPTTATHEPIPAPVTQAIPEISTPAVPFAESFARPTISSAQSSPAHSEPPTPTASVATVATASEFSVRQTPPHQPPQLRNPQREVVVSADHPFRQYLGVPNDPQTKITGKPMAVAELFAGTRSHAVRSQLLRAYWELSGLLAVYHFRCEAERLASGTAGQQQDLMTLLREQRRTAEVEFIKQQWVLAELLTLYKGRPLRESELPIPMDYPLYPRYQTHAHQIARTERTRHLARMIPIQEQLVESKNGTWKAASEMMPNASQPYFVVSNQRTVAFLELTKAIVDYNKMIAEYALETIPSNVSQQQLVGAVVRLPRVDATPTQPQIPQMATEGIRTTQYEVPIGIPAQSIQQVAHEFHVEHQLSSPLSPYLMPEVAETPVVTETNESESTAASPKFLMDF